MTPESFLPMLSVLCCDELQMINDFYIAADQEGYHNMLIDYLVEMSKYVDKDGMKIKEMHEAGIWEPLTLLKATPDEKFDFLILYELWKADELHFYLDIPKCLQIIPEVKINISKHIDLIYKYVHAYADLQQLYEESRKEQKKEEKKLKSKLSQYKDKDLKSSSEKSYLRRCWQIQGEADLKMAMKILNIYSKKYQMKNLKNTEDMMDAIKLLQSQYRDQERIHQKTVEQVTALETEKSSRYKGRRENNDKRLADYCAAKASSPNIKDTEIYASWIKEEYPNVKPKTKQYDDLIHKWVVWKSRVVKMWMNNKKS